MKRIIVLLAACIWAASAQAADKRPTHLLIGQKLMAAGDYCQTLPALKRLAEAYKNSDDLTIRMFSGPRDSGKLCYRGTNRITIVGERGKLEGVLSGRTPNLGAEAKITYHFVEVRIEGEDKPSFFASPLPVGIGT